MLWLKAWLETRWRVAWALMIGILFFAMPIISTRNAPSTTAAQVRVALLMFLIVQAAIFAAIMLAGSGIHTASTRAGASDKGAERSMIFTLSLPVTRLRLFLVRTATGILETGIFLAILFTALWILWPQPTTSPRDALGYFAMVAACSLAVYALSACLSTFCDEGARVRASVVILIVPSAFVFRAGRSSVNTFHDLALTTHAASGLIIGTAIALAALFFAAAILIIQRRDY
ncbi:MAG TPA: hypothetical protein VN660_05575 [Steroidobacteraceae bacterium]|nr:hypothetical protein [Steroidobacteraceae bacterium]